MRLGDFFGCFRNHAAFQKCLDVKPRLSEVINCYSEVWEPSVYWKLFEDLD